MTYVTYKCTVCRREKSEVRDVERATPNQCIITKGCLGRLIPVGETTVPIDTTPLAGVENWYPRGTSKTQEVETATPLSFVMTTSAASALTLAVKSADESSLPEQLNLKISQKRVSQVNFQQFKFKALQGATVISGKDVNGKNLRIDQSSIDGRLVIVKVNGVVTFPGMTINSLTFLTPLSAGAVVDVLILSDSLSEAKTITLTRNKILVPSLGRGAWSNIDFIDKLENDGSKSRWYLYSVDSLGDLTSGKIRIDRNDVSENVVFLLASSPFQSTDRYLNFQIPKANVSSDFMISHESGKLIAPFEVIEEIFPPIEISSSSYITDDFFTVAGSLDHSTDLALGTLNSEKILGPI